MESGILNARRKCGGYHASHARAGTVVCSVRSIVASQLSSHIVGVVALSSCARRLSAAILIALLSISGTFAQASSNDQFDLVCDYRYLVCNYDARDETETITLAPKPATVGTVGRKLVCIPWC
jgi:hypothetical protein